MLNDAERRRVAEAVRDPDKVPAMERGRLRAMRERAGPSDRRAIDRVLGGIHQSTGDEPKPSSVEAGRERARRARAEQQRAEEQRRESFASVGTPDASKGIPTVGERLGAKAEPEADRFWAAFDAARQEGK